MLKKFIVVWLLFFGFVLLESMKAQVTISTPQKSIYKFMIRMNKVPNSGTLGALKEYLRGAFKNQNDEFSDFETLSAEELFPLGATFIKPENFIYCNDP